MVIDSTLNSHETTASTADAADAAEAAYIVEIVEMALHIRKLKISGTYTKNMANALVRIPIDRVVQKISS